MHINNAHFSCYAPKLKFKGKDDKDSEPNSNKTSRSSTGISIPEQYQPKALPDMMKKLNAVIAPTIEEKIKETKAYWAEKLKKADFSQHTKPPYE